jgi:DNA-directed RNA polymerase subunit M/transcription elongation factor TFIIS
MSNVEKRQLCKCENCGNEAEMVVTCSLPDAPENPPQETAVENKADGAPPHKVKGHATCTHCGNEADMWIDY